MGEGVAPIPNLTTVMQVPFRTRRARSRVLRHRPNRERPVSLGSAQQRAPDDLARHGKDSDQKPTGPEPYVGLFFLCKGLTFRCNTHTKRNPRRSFHWSSGVGFHRRPYRAALVARRKRASRKPRTAPAVAT
jgi:hypothetical protein